MKRYSRTSVAAGLVVALHAGICLAQDQQVEPAKEPEKQQPAGQTGDKQGDLPGLDDLLGLPKPKEEQSPASDDALRRELEDKLAGQEIAEQFDEAVRLMGQTADRLESARDTGIATQRLQEDVLKKLDALIAAAKKRKDNSSSSSAQSKPDPRPSQPNQPQNGQSQAGRGENRGQVNPPGRKDGPVNPALDQTGAAWGSLPAHVREALSQGMTDSYSSLYRALTEAYYRRLAEEAGK